MESKMSSQRTFLQEGGEATGLSGVMETEGGRFSRWTGKVFGFGQELSGEQAYAQGSLRAVLKKSKQNVLTQQFKKSVICERKKGRERDWDVSDAKRLSRMKKKCIKDG